MPPMPVVFPDYPAPVVRNAGTERELLVMRWDCRLHDFLWSAAYYLQPRQIVSVRFSFSSSA